MDLYQPPTEMVLEEIPPAKRKKLSRTLWMLAVLLASLFIWSRDNDEVAAVSISAGSPVEVNIAYAARGVVLANHVPLGVAVGLGAAASIPFLTGYLRTVIGPRFAMTNALANQLVYLTLLAVSMRYTAIWDVMLAIAGSATLLVLMRVTARGVDWSFPLRNQEPSPARLRLSAYY